MQQLIKAALIYIAHFNAQTAQLSWFSVAWDPRSYATSMDGLLAASADYTSLWTMLKLLL